jgi:hypothetical protein
MRNMFSIILLLSFNINCLCQETCDSNLFKHLINISNQNNISIIEFQKCEKIVYDLWDKKCYDYVKSVNEENYAIGNLTYLFGRICIKADCDQAVKSYINYIQKNKGSAEEQLDFSFENIFVKRPESVLVEISKQDSSYIHRLLSDLAWGFVNNRAFGIEDPFANNQFKAMTVHNDPPKVILDSTNYRFIYFSLNPAIKRLYPKYRNYIEFELSEVLDMIRFDAQHR